MTVRAEAAAEEFARVIAEVLATVEGYSDDEWRRIRPNEGWIGGVTIHAHRRDLPPKHRDDTGADGGRGPLRSLMVGQRPTKSMPRFAASPILRMHLPGIRTALGK